MNNEWSFKSCLELFWLRIKLFFSKLSLHVFSTTAIMFILDSFLMLLFIVLCIILIILTSFVLQIKSLRKVKVQLNSSKLVQSSKAILDLDINLGTIEGTITRIELPFSSCFIKHLFQLLFCIVPHVNASNMLLRSC